MKMNIAKFMADNKNLEINKYARLLESYIYLICEDNGDIMYVGSTTNLWARILQHSSRVEFYSKPIYYFPCPLEQCRNIERELINKIKPAFNVLYVNGKQKRRENIIPSGRRHVKSKIDNGEREELRNEIRTLLKKNNITQGKLAALACVSRQRMSQLLNDFGRSSDTTINKLRRLITLLKR